MTNYTQSCIYKIACKDPNIEDTYIGSTCNFVKRRYSHKNACNNPNNKHYNQYIYRFIRSNGGWGNFNLYVIEKFSCTSKMQKEQVERGYIEELKPSLNKCIPANYQTGDVYSKSEYTKGYQKHNKEHIAEYSKAYYEMDKDKILKQVKEYRENHKEQQKAYQQKTILCPQCDHMINLANRARHNRSERHISNSSTSSSESSEEDQDTMMTEMNKLHDDNELKLQEMKNTCYKIDKLIH